MTSIKPEKTSFKTISISGQTDVVANSESDTLTLAEGSNITLTTEDKKITIAASGGGGGGGSTNAFSTIAVDGQTDIEADSSTDTLTFAAGTGISIANNASSDTITITSTVTDTNTTYTAGDGLDLTGTAFSTDLKASGGLVIESTELAVDLGAGSITGTLAISDGGTGATTAENAASALGVGTEDSPSFSGLNLHNDANNADTTLSIGTSATECLNIICLNGDSNKTAEHIQFISKTESETTDHGTISFHIDDSESSILDITDTGIFVEFGASVGNLGVGMEASGTEGQIDATGDIIAFSSSDKRLKTNIQPIQDPLTKLQKIGGYTFDWIPKEGIHSHKGNDIGVIAQEIEEVLPEITTTRDNGYKAVKYEKLTAYLIECVKAQQTHIQQLEDRLVKLEKND